jgi:Tol biopolymer transport system component/DNA-binding winged helix-turn-helix (wHTH) protein
VTRFDLARLVRFGVFEVDLRTGELRKRGQRIPLQEQPFQVLAALLEQPGEVVTREQLRLKLWPAETFVDFDHSLNVAVRRLRDAMGESAESPVFIETVARRGYRFIAPLAKEQQVPGTPPNTPPPTTRQHSRRNFIMAIGAASVVAVGALVLWWPYRTTRISPRIVRSKQLTFSGQIGNPYFTEARQSIQTDGQRIYYSDKLSRLRFISVTGGEEGYVQTDAVNVALLHISPDGLKLLVRDFISSEGSSESPLWLVPANGGPRQRLGDIQAQDAAWSPDGKTIAFAQGANLFLTDDLGAPPRKLATTPGRPFWLRWSPDGKVLRFTLNDTKTDVRTLWEANLSGAIQQLFAGWKDRDYSCCGIWSPDGRYYLFLHDSEDQVQLWAQRENRFARNYFEPVLVSVNQVGITFTALASSTSQKKLFVLGLNPLAEAYAVDPKDKRPLQLLPKLPANDLTFSRDGKWVSFFSQDATKSLWRAHADGTGRTQLTSPPLEVVYPVFSPDASRIAIMARMPGQPFKVYWVNAEGGTLHELRTDVIQQADPTWSTDGQSIIFGEPTNLWIDSGKQKAMYISNLKSGQTSKIPGSDGWFGPRMSPDGRTLAALSLDLKRLGLFDFHTSRWRDLPQPNVPNGAFWSADSQWVYFNEGDDEVWRLRVRDGHSEFVLSTSSILPNHSCFASGFTPEQSIIFPCIRRSSDLYELDWE